MFEILYRIIISPLEYIIENLFCIFNYTFQLELVSSIFFISFAVTMMCLPFYYRADKIRKEEEEKYSELKPYVNKIKKNFKGDEQFFMLQTLYRQHNYNPIMALRNSFSLLLQIPFFIAAYHFFSNLELLNGYSWGPIQDLSQPDKLLDINSLKINFLPFLMTIVNIISCEFFFKTKTFKTRLQPYLFAFVFLVLLYSSPSGLVLYWTFNNFLYLLKNKYMETCPKKYVFILIVLGILVYYYNSYIIYASFDYLLFQLFFTIFIFFILYILSKVIIQKIKNCFGVFEYTFDSKIFILSSIGFILLQGIIIPLGLMTSDLSVFVTELNNTKNLINIVFENICSLSGLYLFWGLIVLYFIKKEYRIYYIIIYLSIFIFSIFNYFNFSDNLGTINFALVFEDNDVVEKNFGSLFTQLSNVFVFCLIAFLVTYAFKKNLKKQILYFFIILFMSILIISGLYLYSFINSMKNIEKSNNKNFQIGEIFNNISLSKSQRNVIIIFLDRFTGCFLPQILEEKPELKKIYSGFVFYPNTLSYYGSTVLGYPSMIGGYEYNPYVLDKDKRNFSEKWLEASLMLLILFKNNNYLSTVVDPLGDSNDLNMRFYKDNLDDVYSSKGINIVKLASKYRNFPEFSKLQLNDSKILNRIQKKLFIYSFFNITLDSFKTIIYNNGFYLLIRNNGDNPNFSSEKTVFNSYYSLSYLKNITKLDSNKNTFTIIHNELPHNMGYFKYPDYRYSRNPTNIGINKFKNDKTFMSYHTAMAATLLVGEYLDSLKKLEVYDNSRIIIVSDHGNRYANFPSLTKFQNKNVVPFNPLLMIKDFGQKFELKSNDSFMTNADVPYIATKELIDNAKNPFTGKILSTFEKQNGIDVYTNHRFWNASQFTSNRVILDKYPKIKHVEDNIFYEENWKERKFCKDE